MRTSFAFAAVLASIGPLVKAYLIPHAGHPALQRPFAPFLPNVSQASYVCTHRVDADVDFLIVGAGMTGLGEAHYLHAHTRGCVIQILEAQESEY
jgi:hypothetical protein